MAAVASGSPAHRRAFETAAHRFLGRLIAAGDLSVAALGAAPATRALLPGAILGDDGYPIV